MRALVDQIQSLRLSVSLAILSILFAGTLTAFVSAQTDCADGNAALDQTPPKGIAPDELIRKFAAQETKVRDARSRYTYTQDVLVQTLNSTAVDGQFHEITDVSFDDKGKRIDNVKFSEVPTLQDVQLSAEDKDDIATFMPWILTADQLPDYKIMYAGQQHVDDLDTYVFRVEPAKEEKNKRYFQGRVWVDNRDLQIVKLCGKTVPEQIRRKKKDPIEVRPTFAGYRQLVDGYWFPAYARVDDILHFGPQSVHLREVVKFKDYKRREPTAAVVSKP
ncbi:MAG TPA: hypothetical protein VMS18_30245 [Candidatus Binatia bacterium]|nr:hypothetical protein [Candidatus Binatia bacterium]